MDRHLFAGACASVLAACAAPCAYADPHFDDDPPAAVSQVVVTGARSAAAIDRLPNATESVTAAQVGDQVNAVTVEDALRYLPDVLIRQRHFGDDQDPITTRTSGVGASARSLIYADGVLLSALIGNNNTSASPKWSLVAPDAVARIDVMYGPFAAQYPGNSIGSVIEITTKAPTGPEASIEAQGAGQTFGKYADDRTFGTGRAAVSLGDRVGPFSARLAYSHLDTSAQPLTYATATLGKPGTAGTPVSGAILDANRAGAPIEVLGSTALSHQVQDTLDARLTYDLTPTLTAAYTAGFFRNDEHDGVNSYLRDAAGNPVYAGAVNIAGRAYTLANTVFSNSNYHFEEDELTQGLSLASHTGGVFDFELIGTTFDYLKSRQRIPSGMLPQAFGGGPGSTVSLDGTGWWTLDGKGTWRPTGPLASNVVTFGAHLDAFKLNNPRYVLTDWLNGSAGATTSFSRGRTETQGLWAQDVWTLAPQLTATLGARYEHWDAYDGLNVATTPNRLSVNQPTQGDWRLSPKAVLAFAPAPGWVLKASAGIAYRFPTVQELYQAVTAGAILAVPNPNLRPEHAQSAELSAERNWAGGHARLSLFSERISGALISQTAQLATGPNTTAPASFVQNVDLTRARGVELVAGQDDVGIKGLGLEGWITYVDGRTVHDAADRLAIGKRLPQLPRLRGSLAATYKPDMRWAFTVAGRYSDCTFGTIENTDTYANTYQGFGAWFVMDAHVRYRVTRHLTAEVGADNLLDRTYFLFHPFPGRTVIGDVKYDF